MSDDHSNFEVQAIRILGSFQILELSIKTYIAGAYQLVKKRLAGAIPFEYDFEHVDTFPLEKLLNIFSRLNSNKELQRRMNKLRDKRNEIAHRALLYQHDFIRDFFKIDIATHALNLNETEVELKTCLELMGAELRDITAKFNVGAA